MELSFLLNYYLLSFENYFEDLRKFLGSVSVLKCRNLTGLKLVTTLSHTVIRIELISAVNLINQQFSFITLFVVNFIIY